MLGLIFRGVFLIGILTWYSTSVWEMIDGYFRDQFKNYLEEEYRKNPRMRSDVKQDSADKIGPAVTTPRLETTVEPPRGILEADQVCTRAVEAVENDTAAAGESKETSRVTGGTTDARGSTDKNAYLGIALQSGLESRKLLQSKQDSRQSINRDDPDREEQENQDFQQLVPALSENSWKKIKYSKKLVAPRDFSRQDRLSSRGNVKSITMNAGDSKATAKRSSSSDDFWEFDEDAIEREPSEGILVSELPFKPRADIGDLDRVTGEEYCPLTPEDEASCDETKSWP